MSLTTGICLILFSLFSHVLVLASLSNRRNYLSHRSSPPSSVWSFQVSTAFINGMGLLSAATTLALPYTSFPGEAFIQSAVRCVCYFYAFKILDLSFAKANSPPTRLQSDSNNVVQWPAPMESYSDRVKYVYLLLTEMRYPSFDIAVKQKNRPSPGNDSLNDAWTWMPPVVILALVFSVPTPESKALLLFLIIYLSFELLHMILHVSRTSCNQSLFYKPFAAASFATFWATHWHAAAAPFLQSLGYRPGRRYVGKWFGVLVTFNLTGIWHAWATVPYVDSQSKTFFGLKVWAMFMMWGIGILAERWIWNERQGGLVQRIAVWSVSVLMAGSCIRTFECHTNIEWFRKDTC